MVFGTAGADTTLCMEYRDKKTEAKRATRTVVKVQEDKARGIEQEG